NHLAEKLEERRLDTPQQLSDRGVNYSNGAHGLRHSYAQNRYEQLANHFERIDVMTIISQELGHFRPDITEVYLR
ncbi:site-specific integrase, partial [Vibrio cholerae]|nr:site-specific integrase [Vibrio cholerae]